MTTPTKNAASTSSSSATKDNGERPEASGTRASSPSTATLAELARNQEELTQQVRELVARQAVDREPLVGDDRDSVSRMVEGARTELLEQLRDEENEQARRQLAQAVRSSEDAAAGVVRSATTIVRTVVPVALVRPEDLIEAAYALADQGLRVSRQLALTISSSVRSLTTAA
jgi:hypothetical protein